MSAYNTIEGLISETGRQYLNITQKDFSVCVLRDNLSENATRAAIIKAGLEAQSTKSWQRLLEKADGHTEFTAASVIEKIGWNGSRFALPDGTVFSSDSEDAAYIAIDLHPELCRKEGKFSAWRDGVALPLAGQTLPLFALLCAFMPPLLALTDRMENVGFEFVGNMAGNSTMLLLAASAMGGIGESGGREYVTSVETCSATRGAISSLYSDHLMIMDDSYLSVIDASAAKKADAFSSVAFKLHTWSSGLIADHPSRLGYVLCGDHALGARLDQSPDAIEAARDRLITIPVEEPRAFGIFDSLPEEHKSSSAFAHSLISHAARHHGHAFRRFIKALVAARAENEGKLRKVINCRVERFLDEADVDRNNGSEVRVGTAFGLVYAAGALAKEFDVLPKKLGQKSAVLACHQLHRSLQPKPVMSFADRLSELTQSPFVGAASLFMRGGCAGTLDKRGRSSELWIDPKHIEELIPDWSRIKKTDEVQALQMREEGRQTIKRQAGEKSKRVFVFRVNT